MSNWIESKFSLDYQKFKTLPNQVIDNFHEINARNKGVERIMRIKEQIEDLKYALEAETHLIASNVLENNVFPRFMGYSEFINGSCGGVVSKNPSTFCELAVLFSNKEDSCKEYASKFQSRLNDFIWLFFDGCGTFNTTKKLAIDYANYKYTYGSYNDSYPSQISYLFNVTNFKNGRTHKIDFSFYDIKKALEFQRLRYKDPTATASNVWLAAPFESIRLSNFGKIECIIAEVKEASYNGVHQLGDKIYLSSFDPLEIAAFIRSQTIEKDDDNKQQYSD